MVAFGVELGWRHADVVAVRANLPLMQWFVRRLRHISRSITWHRMQAVFKTAAAPVVDAAYMGSQTPEGYAGMPAGKQKAQANTWTLCHRFNRQSYVSFRNP